MKGQRVLTFAVFAAMLHSGVAAAADFSFDCDGAKTLVDLLELGPDEAVDEIVDSPDFFARDTIGGWKCTTIPFPPLRRDRVYLEGLSCMTSDDKTPVTEQDLSNAGRRYQAELAAVFSCFGDDVFISTPSSYTNTSKGEEINVALKRYVPNPSGGEHYVVVKYGYFQDRKTPIIWEIAAAIGSKRRD